MCLHISGKVHTPRTNPLIILLSLQAFSQNGDMTIRTLNAQFQDVIGTAEHLSFADLKLANIIYSCSGEPRRLPCGDPRSPRADGRGLAAETKLLHPDPPLKDRSKFGRVVSDNEQILTYFAIKNLQCF